MFKILDRKSFIMILNIFCVIFTFFIIPSLLYNDVITNHDSSYVFQYTYDHNWFSSARFISRFCVSFFYVGLPSIFNIHQNDISSFIVPAFSSLFISIMSIFTLKIYYLFKDGNQSIFKNSDFFILYPIIYIINAFIPPIHENLDMFYLSGLSETVVYYDDLFNYLFFIIFIYFIISSFFKERGIFKNHLYAINAFLLGISYEPISFISSIIFILTLLLVILFNKKTIHELNCNTVITLSFVCFPLLIGAFLQFILSNYSHGQITEYAISIPEQLMSIGNIFIPYIQDLFALIIKDNIALLLPILILSIYIFKHKDDKYVTYKLLCFSFIVIISCLTYFLLLIIPGHCDVYPYDFWFYHPPFRIIFSRILIALIILEAGYIIFKMQCFTKVLRTFLIIFLYSLLIFNFNELKSCYDSECNDIHQMRKQIYISDKISLTYSNLDGIALLPISYYEKYSVHKFIFRPRCYDADADIREKMRDIVKKEVESEQSRLFSNINENDYLLYLYYTYGIKLKGIIWVDDDIAFSEFNKRNGSFTESELKNLNFTSLKKQMKPNNYTIEELTEKIKQNKNKAYLFATCGLLYEKNNEFDKAVDDYTKALLLDNNSYKQYYYLRAEANLKNNKINEAEKDYISFIKISPYSFEARKKLADLYISQENYEKALIVYNELIKIFEFYNENIKKTFHSDIADIQYQLKRYDDVLKTVNKDEALTPYYANYQVRALAKMESNDYVGALDDINKAIQYNLSDEYTFKIKERIESKINNK